MKITKTYCFRLRGVHNLSSIDEPTHGHSATLEVSLLCPIQNEEQFLRMVKNKIVRDFDKADWAKSIDGEPTGENVVLAIKDQFLKLGLKEKLENLCLVETQKNKFHLHVSDE